MIDEYSKHKSKKHHKQFIISMMQAKIIALDPSKISNHFADPMKLNVIDIAPSSIGPPQDPAYHLEIPQPEKS